MIIRKLILLFLKKRKKRFGYCGVNTVVPSDTEISNSSNIYLYDNVTIGGNAILYATNAKIIIKNYFVSANGLRIVTGRHERRIGRYLASITEEEKNKNIGLDNDVIINEDVWCGFNVTILDGVEIGRGCTVAAGSIVTKSCPPYSVVGGVPARVKKYY